MTHKEYPLEERCLITPATQERPTESMPRQTEAVLVEQSEVGFSMNFIHLYASTSHYETSIMSRVLQLRDTKLLQRKTIRKEGRKEG